VSLETQIHLAEALGGALATWTVTVAAFTWWLSRQFRRMEQLFYKALTNHHNQDEERFGHVNDRLTRVETRQETLDYLRPRAQRGT